MDNILSRKLTEGRIDLRIVRKHSAGLWVKHQRDWRACTRCNLHKHREHVCFYRGMIPCDVLFIGEAPGQAEDICGKPFVGDAGYMLQSIIKRVSEEIEFAFAITNLVSCIPLENHEPGERKLRVPNEEEITACSTKLGETIYLASPKLIVLLGNHAHRYYPKGPGTVYSTIPTLELVHPAFLVRKSSFTQGLAIDTVVLKLTKAIKEIADD